MNIKPGKHIEDLSLTFALEVDFVKFQYVMGLRYLGILTTVYTINTHDFYVNN